MSETQTNPCAFHWCTIECTLGGAFCCSFAWWKNFRCPKIDWGLSGICWRCRVFFDGLAVSYRRRQKYNNHRRQLKRTHIAYRTTGYINWRQLKSSYRKSNFISITALALQLYRTEFINLLIKVEPNFRSNLSEWMGEVYNRNWNSKRNDEIN